MTSRVIRVDQDVYERLSQLGIVLNTDTPSRTLEAWMNLSMDERNLIRTEMEELFDDFWQ